MSGIIKNQRSILDKLKIEKLNPMQDEALELIKTNSNIVLLSPTGTGKTLAFLLPIIEELDASCHEVQTLILTPSRELAIQIEQVIREMGAGFKVNVVYGGRAGSHDKIDLKHRPAILVGTPGRIADHLRKETFPITFIKTLVLDEFDKSLEIGFEPEMKEIIKTLSKVKKKILTSATPKVKIPIFIALRNPIYINYLEDGLPHLTVKTILSPTEDKLKTLVEILGYLGNQPGIIFCNFKDSIQTVSDYLAKNKINHNCFHGDMEQPDREKSLIKFRNGTHQILLATDLAARGIDIPEIKFIIHYQLPLKLKEFTHRNGRTARMNKEGSAYILNWERDEFPEFIKEIKPETILAKDLQQPPISENTVWTTLYISGGRRDKISKGDIAGLLLKQANLKINEVGNIEIKQDCAFVAVAAAQVEHVIASTNNTKLKNKKIRISIF